MSYASVPSDAVLAPGSLILLTGITGYIGSHTANELLKRGYRVRGIVRSINKAAWLTELFAPVYGASAFSLVEIPNMTEGALTPEIMQDVNGFIHLASDVTFSPDPTVVIPNALELTNIALRAAASTPTLTRFVLTSSSVAAFYPPGSPGFKVTISSFNTDAVIHAQAPPPYEPARAFAVYAASKTLAEQAMWEFATSHPNIAFNAVLPDFNTGAPLSVEHQGIPSTAGAVAAFFQGNTAFPRSTFPAQNYIHVVDTALLHVAALLSPTADRERVFGFAGPKNWNSTYEAIKTLYPDREIRADYVEGEEETTAVIVPKDRAEELLKWVEGRGWVGFVNSVREITEIVVRLKREGKKVPAGWFG